jgi:hypothetical protein
LRTSSKEPVKPGDASNEKVKMVKRQGEEESSEPEETTEEDTSATTNTDTPR